MTMINLPDQFWKDNWPNNAETRRKQRIINFVNIFEYLSTNISLIKVNIKISFYLLYMRT